MKIESATLQDLPQIVEIYNSTIASHMVTADIDLVSIDSKKEWLEKE